MRLGILGGTLDPIHCGHVDAATAARDGLALDRVLIVPSRVPPHRPEQPIASGYHRFAMTALAVNGRERLEASDLELTAPGDAPSFTAETLDRVGRSGVPASQIFFIIGVDAFAEIATWRRYPEVLDLARFVVISRPGHDIDALRTKLPGLAPRMHVPRTAADVPATAGILLLESPTADVSATMIRDRLRRGEAITGLVPPLVERHIAQHGLYGQD